MDGNLLCVAASLVILEWQSQALSKSPKTSACLSKPAAAASAAGAAAFLCKPLEYELRAQPSLQVSVAIRSE